jgi:hypothetical protein
MRKPDVTFYVDGDGERCVEVKVKLGVKDLNGQYEWLLALSESLESHPEALEGLLGMHEGIRERIEAAERGWCPQVTDEEHQQAIKGVERDISPRS